MHRVAHRYKLIASQSFHSWSDSSIRLHFLFTPIGLRTPLLQSALRWIAKAGEPGPKSLVPQMTIHLSESSLSGPPTSHDQSPSPAPHSRRPPPPHLQASLLRYLSKFATPLTLILPQPTPLFPNTNGLTKAQRTRLFEIELEKSEQQMRQAAAVANQAERLQQVAEDKALLEIE